METKICVQCGEFKSIEDFNISFQNVNAQNGYNQKISRKNRCKTCYSKRERLKIRIQFINAYGSVCSCCGESDIRFLGLDHINNDGNIQRLEINCQQIYYQARKEGYPKDKYQLLCHNCNFGKSTNGGICPHKYKTKIEYLKEINEFINHSDQSFRQNYNREGLKLGPKTSHIEANGKPEDKLRLALKKLGYSEDLINEKLKIFIKS